MCIHRSTWLVRDFCWILVILKMIAHIQPSSANLPALQHPSLLRLLPSGDEHSKLVIPGKNSFRVRRTAPEIPGESLYKGPSAANARYIIGSSPTSQPIMFFDDLDTESHVVRNTMLIVKKKKPPEDSPSTLDKYPLLNSDYHDSFFRIPAYHRPTQWTSTTSRPLSDHLTVWGLGEQAPTTEATRYRKPTPWKVENLGSVWKRTTQSPGIINNHHPGGYVKPRPTTVPPKRVSTVGTQLSEVVWRPPTTKFPPAGVISNHMSNSGGFSTWRKPTRHDSSSEKLPFQRWKHKISTTTSTTTTPKPSSTEAHHIVDRAPTSTSHHVKKPLFQVKDEVIQVNNHKIPGVPVRKKPTVSTRPQYVPTGSMTMVDKHKEMAVDLLGGRIKHPDTVTSKPMTVLDAPSDRLTTVKHNKIIVAQKRMDSFSQITTVAPVFEQATTSSLITSNPILTISTKKTKKATTPTKSPSKSSKPSNAQSFPVAPVLDPWDNIPIPSAPSWAEKPSPTKGQSLSSSSFPGLPFLPFLSSLISPLMSKPLTPAAVNTGIQGIKAMQGFIRNSLMGAMFCFLPSALIALRLSATQRAELRKTPEMDEMVTFCKKCLENLKSVKKMALEDQPDWTQKI